MAAKSTKITGKDKGTRITELKQLVKAKTLVMGQCTQKEVVKKVATVLKDYHDLLQVNQGHGITTSLADLSLESLQKISDSMSSGNTDHKINVVAKEIFKKEYEALSEASYDIKTAEEVGSSK